MVGLPLGSLAARQLGSNPWNDGYPALPADVEEFDNLWLFAYDEGRIDHYVSRLSGKLAQRDEALNELRVALALKSLGYRIVEWEPLGNGAKRGEYSITQDGHGVIFVEVKSPGWEGELAPEERAAGRTKQPKYIPGERRGGPLATWQRIRCCVEQAYSKFSPDRTNILVIADDFRVPLDDQQMGIALYNPVASLLAPLGCSDYACSDYGLGPFASSTFENIGSVARLTNELLSRQDYVDDCYRLRFYHNPFARKPVPPLL